MDDAARSLAIQMLAETRDEVTRADAKASTLLTGLGLVVGVVGAAALAGDWSPRQLGYEWRFAWWAGACFAVLAAGFLGWAVLPRITHKASAPALGYFNDVALLKSVEQLEAALDRVDPDQRLVSQLYAVSNVARRKYIAVRRGLIAAAVGVGLIVVSTLAG